MPRFAILLILAILLNSPPRETARHIPGGFRDDVGYVVSGEGGAPFDRYQQPPYSSWLILLARVTPQEGFELISKKLDEADDKIVN